MPNRCIRSLSTINNGRGVSTPCDGRINNASCELMACSERALPSLSRGLSVAPCTCVYSLTADPLLTDISHSPTATLAQQLHGMIDMTPSLTRVSLAPAPRSSLFAPRSPLFALRSSLLAPRSSLPLPLPLPLPRAPQTASGSSSQAAPAYGSTWARPFTSQAEVVPQSTYATMGGQSGAEPTVMVLTMTVRYSSCCERAPRFSVTICKRRMLSSRITRLP